MEKRIIIAFALLLLMLTTAEAQSWKEWFRQKKTQKEYLLKQIAALKMYLDYTREGYEIIQDGASLVSDIKTGEFSLHKSYFGSLNEVSPAVRGYDKAKAILEIGHALSAARDQGRLLMNSEMLSAAERQTLEKIYKNLIREAAADLEIFRLVLEDHGVEMADHERIKHIDRLHEAMQKRKVFLERLNRAVAAFTEGRIGHDENREFLRSLYGVNP